jgi:hypothetical protein
MKVETIEKIGIVLTVTFICAFNIALVVAVYYGVL